MIEAIDMGFSLGETKILSGISLQLRRGEIVVIIGSSGAGKSSLINCMSLLKNPTVGKVRFGGVEYQFPSTEVRRAQFGGSTLMPRLGVVFQDLYLLPHWTNLENILKPLGGSLSNEQRIRMDQLVKSFGLSAFLHKFPNQCSRGEEQRVAFCRALMLNPDFLFLDEVTASLDSEYIVALLDQIVKLKQEGKGILLATHYIPFASRAADRVIFLEHGMILEEGGPDILKNPKSERLAAYLDSLKRLMFE